MQAGTSGCMITVTGASGNQYVLVGMGYAEAETEWVIGLARIEEDDTMSVIPIQYNSGAYYPDEDNYQYISYMYQDGKVIYAVT